jgi:hypothetical protein
MVNDQGLTDAGLVQHRVERHQEPARVPVLV